MKLLEKLQYHINRIQEYYHEPPKNKAARSALAGASIGGAAAELARLSKRGGFKNAILHPIEHRKAGLKGAVIGAGVGLAANAIHNHIKNKDKLRKV